MGPGGPHMFCTECYFMQVHVFTIAWWMAHRETSHTCLILQFNPIWAAKHLDSFTLDTCLYDLAQSFNMTHQLFPTTGSCLPGDINYMDLKGATSIVMEDQSTKQNNKLVEV